MKSRKIFSLQISLVMCIIFLICSVVLLFVSNEVESFTQLFQKISQDKAFFGKNIRLLTITILGITCTVFVSMFYVSYFLGEKIFHSISEHNTRLSQYNKYLAHELKTPISVIYGNLEVLKYEFIPEKIKNSQEELKGMIHIIDGLLNYADSLKLQHKEHVNIENILKRYISFQKGKQKIYVHNGGFNISIYTDEILFGRIIKNLIENASKYSGDGSLDIYINEGNLRFENPIQNTLSKTEIQKLFESSYGKSFEEKRGHQIGLPMIREITKLLGYTLIVSSIHKKFIVTIEFGEEK